MVSVADWNATPDLNITVNGINIAEGCPAANLNGALRAVMAGVRNLYDNLPTASNYILKDGSVSFTGQPLFSGRGAFLHHSNSANASGKVFVQASGGAVPSMADGDILIEYTA